MFTFWVNVRNPSMPHLNGRMVMAINDWRDFASVM